MSKDSVQTSKGKWSRRLMVLGVLVLVLGGVVLIWNASGAAAYNAAIERGRAVDPLLTYDEIFAAQTPLPDGKNAALYFESIQPQFKAAKDKHEAALSELVIVGEARGADLGERWSDEMRQKVTAALADLAPELALVDRLADYEKGRFKREIPENPMDAWASWNLAAWRSAAKYEALQMLHAAHEDDPEAFIRHLSAATTTGRFGDEGMCVLDFLVSCAIDDLAVSSVEAGLALTDFDDEQLDRIDAQLRRMDVPERLLSGIRGERALHHGFAEYAMDNPDALNDFSNVPVGTIAKVPGSSGLFYRDLANCLDHYNRLVEVVRDGETDPTVLRELDIAVAKTSPIYFLTRTLMPSLVRAIDLERRPIARARAARVGIALEKYRLDHGDWPASLDELVPGYIDAIPDDPFSKKPLLYQIGKNGVVVYSIGEDLVDDGGNIHYVKSNPNRPVQPTDFGFELLNPDQRNRPATTQPAGDEQ